LAQKTENTKKISKTSPNKRDGKNKHSSDQKPLVRAKRNERRNEERFLYNRWK